MQVWIGASAAVLALAMAMPAAAQEIKLTPTVALVTLDQAAADPAFETKTLGDLQAVQVTPRGAATAYLLRKDRGPHAGRYAVFVTMPREGAPGMAYTKVAPNLTPYQLIGADNIGALPTVDILGVHYIKVQPGKQAAFDKFVTEKLNPAVANLRPDLRFLYYKSPDGGYISVIAITKASRDKYWPGGSDSDDLKTAFTPAVRQLAKELEPFLVEGTWGTGMTAEVYEAKEWADWLVVPAGK